MKNEKRLIDANEFWNRLSHVVYDIFTVHENNGQLSGTASVGYYTETIQEVLKQTKTVDAVEVVRKPVRGYEGHYVVDQFGRVYGVDRISTVQDNGRIYDKPIAGKQMKQSLHTKGYKTVTLTKDGKSKTRFVHRLVAEAFIDNPDNLPMVNHKDEDKTNNFAENLEWCTASYNCTYGKAVEKRAKKIRGRESEKRIAVIQRGLDGEFLFWHPSITEAAKSVNSRPQAISAVCNGKRKSHRGYLWSFVEDDFCSYGERREGE